MAKYQKKTTGDLLGVGGMTTAIMPDIEIEKIPDTVIPKDSATRKRRTKRKLATKTRQQQRRKKPKKRRKK